MKQLNILLLFSVLITGCYGDASVYEKLVDATKVLAKEPLTESCRQTWLDCAQQAFAIGSSREEIANSLKCPPKGFRLVEDDHAKARLIVEITPDPKERVSLRLWLLLSPDGRVSGYQRFFHFAPEELSPPAGQNEELKGTGQKF